jgi:hypothetical protein
MLFNGLWFLTFMFRALAAPRNDYINEDFPDEDEPDASARAPAPRIPSHTSPVANKSQALLQTRKSMAGWDICNMIMS